MGGVLAKLFESDIITFLIVFVAVPYLYLSLAADVQKDCAEVARFVVGEKNKSKAKEINEYLDEISYVFNLDWWIIAAVAILLICLFYSGVFLSHSSFFCSTPNQTSFFVQCKGSNTDAITTMRTIFMIYTILVGLILAFRIWWARIIVAKQIRELYAKLGIAQRSLTALR